MNIEWQFLVFMAVLINEIFYCKLCIHICGRNNPIQGFHFGCCGLLSDVKWFSVDFMAKRNFIQISAMTMVDKANY